MRKLVEDEEWPAMERRKEFARVGGVEPDDVRVLIVKGLFTHHRESPNARENVREARLFKALTRLANRSFEHFSVIASKRGS